MKKNILKEYARLIAKMGVNVQKGQEVFIQAELDQPEFVHILAEECYRLGASRVVVDWAYQPLVKTRYDYESVDTVSKVTVYEEARLRHYAKTIPCRIYLESEDPDGLDGADQEKMAIARQKRYPVIKKYRDKIENKYQWCIAAVPGEKWAKKLFPELTKSRAVEKLWDEILTTSRAYGDAVANWEEHNTEIHERCAYLNSLKIKELHYKAKNGTDLTVGMIPQAHFCGASEVSLKGITFNPNIPSEEVFISPMRGKAEGIVYSTKPLCYQGQLIEDFWIRFKKGKAVSWDAKKNCELLKKLINMDEGSAYLGECALVPYDSPISNSGLLFYNTLFDENASCHLALGMGFADTIENYESYTLDECRSMGVNDSMIHQDFMIGTPDMNITAVTEDGKKVKIFKNGNWAF